MLSKRALIRTYVSLLRPEGGSVDLSPPSPTLSQLPLLSNHLSLFLPPLCPCLHSVLSLSLLPHISLYLLSFSSFALTTLHTLFHYDPFIPPLPSALPADGLIMSGVKDVSPSCRIICVSQRLLSRAWKEREREKDEG